MAIPVKCEHCGRVFEAGDQWAGQKVKCSCGQAVQVGKTSEIMDFFCQELNIRNDPLVAQTLDEWAEATGAPPEVAQRIQKRLAPKATSNAGLMMAVTGVVLALLLIVALTAWLLGH